MKSIEANLIRLALKGDQRAFADLVGMYQDKLYHLAYRMLYNRQEAEDAVQETFLRVFRNMERYDESMKFSTWIYRITTNLAIDRLRRRKPGFSLDAEVPEHDGLDGYSMFASEDASPEDEVLLSETQRIIRAAIETLPPKYKSVMVLRYLEDLSLQEISDVLDMPVTTIKTRVHRGREFLRKKLEHKL
ncbi:MULTISPECIES: RNA polymerase sigma factor SigW [unclassified Paenibacillus]|uniref:RNA polymerase sigma factor SigW n=1 Tax=unclassified Paenibacillus TaxID=185978 RepID=UPI0009540AAB|nr:MULTISPECIES: RNA polymerase sigma factor SigW [unclassified Paenibacillus]SIR25938.1 RNA polymerase sigma-70 factor, ECF subfamily [Paenibacillus sp. RU4X]SIR39100.1 RNA polymerase sigma-70 factor, ECF subfamily [Paenibacillus sp. RU4T]